VQPKQPVTLKDDDDDDDNRLLAIPRTTGVNWYQSVSILDFIGAKDNGCGGDNWSYKTRKALVKSSPPTDQHPIITGQMPFLSPNQ